MREETWLPVEMELRVTADAMILYCNACAQTLATFAKDTFAQTIEDTGYFHALQNHAFAGEEDITKFKNDYRDVGNNY